MEQTRRGSGRTSAALRHAMHLAQTGRVAFVAQSLQEASSIVQSAYTIGNEAVRANLFAFSVEGAGVDVPGGRVAGCRNAVFDHRVIETVRDYKLKQIAALQASIDALSNKGHFL